MSLVAQTLSVLPAYANKITAKEISFSEAVTLTAPKDKTVLQGNTTDGKYIYAAFSNSKENTELHKLDLKGKLIAKRDHGKKLGHANDIAYNSKTKKLLVAGANRKIYTIDSSTLKIEKTNSVDSSATNICYNASTDQYVINDYSFDSEFKKNKNVYKSSDVDKALGINSGVDGIVIQGIYCDDQNIYAIRGVKKVTKYGDFAGVAKINWDGEVVAAYKLKIKAEVEGVFVLNDAIHMSFNRGRYSGGNMRKDFIVKLGSEQDARSVSNSSCDQHEVLTNGVSYYNCGSTNMCVDGVAGDNKDYAGNQVIDDLQMKTINDNKPFYEKSAQKENIAWQIIAAVHLREHSLKRSGHENGQGPYQDLNRENVPERLKEGGGWKKGKYDDDEFQIATDWAAKELKNTLKGADLSNSDNIKKLFYAYNSGPGPTEKYIGPKGTPYPYNKQAVGLGYSEEQAMTGEGSPYVMNRADAKRDPVSNPSQKWGQIKVDHGSIEYPANEDYGAYVIYAALGGEQSGGAACPPSTTKDNITRTALELSWPDREHALDDPKPSYKQAMAEVGLDGRSCKGGPPGASCDVFVATVMRYSGADPDFPCCGTDSILPKLRKSPKYQNIGALKDFSILQSGDILLRDGHIMMYVVLEDGSDAIASASCNMRTADHAGKLLPGDKDSGYEVFRLKEGES